VHCDAGDVIERQLDLAGVDTDPDPETEPFEMLRLGLWRPPRRKHSARSQVDEA